MLTVDPEQRIRVADTLKHPWLMAVASVYPDTDTDADGSSEVTGDAILPPPPPVVATPDPAMPQV